MVEGVGVGFRVEGLAGFRTFGPRFRSLGFGVWGFRFRVGSWVQSPGL